MILEIVINILSFLLGLLSTYITYAYFGIFLSKKSLSVTNIIPWIIYALWQYIIISSNALSFMENILINLCLISLIALVTYSDYLLKKLVFVILYLSVGLLVEFIFGYGFEYFKIDYLKSINNQIYTAITIVVSFSFTLLLKRISKNKNIQYRMSDPYSLAVLFTLDCSMFILQIITICFESFTMKWSLLLSLIFLIFQVTFFIVFIKFEEAIHLKYLNKIYEENLRLIDEQAKNKIQADINVKTVYHDLRQHFASLDGFVNAMSDYLKEMMQASAIETANRIANTHCIIVDSIINNKYVEARKKNINFQTDLNIFADMGINCISLGIILGNALDNAIEATLKLPENERFIKIIMNYNFYRQNDEVVIVFINTYKGNIKKNNLNQLISTKKDNAVHGIGLQSIYNEVEKYEGLCDIKFKDNLFTLTIKLFINKVQTTELCDHKVVQTPP